MDCAWSSRVLRARFRHSRLPAPRTPHLVRRERRLPLGHTQPLRQDSSDFTDFAQTARLPLAIDQASSASTFPPRNPSVPGHLTYVSPGQVNVQIPWELQGQSSAQVKVTIDYSNGNLISVPLASYTPAFFHGSDGTVAALDQQSAVVSSTNPARRGQIVQLFANGLGPVTNQPASGEPARSSPTATPPLHRPL